jgi:lipopolysaccharide biosynthesis glycosyltransferase
MEAGLHTMLHSVLSSLSSDWSAQISLLLDGYDLAAKRRLRETLRPFLDLALLTVVDAESTSVQSRARSFHGSSAPYLIFQLPYIVDSDRFLYLDPDVLVSADVSKLYTWNLEGNTLGAVPFNTVGNYWEKQKEFLTKIGVPGTASYFNTGVIVFDSERWKQGRYTEKCLNFAERHPKDLQSADQTVINAVLWSDIEELPKRFNSRPGRFNSFSEDEDRILHLVGSPKPWDIFGEYLHPQHNHFKAVLSKTPFSSSDFRTGWRGFRRTVFLSRSYWELVTQKIFQ